MLWVLKRIVSMRWGVFEHPKHMFKLIENIYNFMLKIFVYLNLCVLFGN